jgi:hypothetical protein
LFLAAAYCFRRHLGERDPEREDLTAIRALTAASFLFFITDVAPFSLYTVPGYLLGQITMIAVVRRLSGGDGTSVVPAAPAVELVAA